VGANRQIISTGGMPGTYSTAWGLKDPWLEGIGVFDMTELAWKSGYDAGAAAYESPQVVRDWYNAGYVHGVWPCHANIC
jgi:hypothetical protein